MKFINANYPRLGLKPYVNPADMDKKLASLDLIDRRQAVARQRDADGDVGSEPFLNDQIHFAHQRDRPTYAFTRRDRPSHSSRFRARAGRT